MQYYEIIAWKDGKNPQRPDYMDQDKKRSWIMMMAKSLAARGYGRVEVNKVSASDYDINDIHSAELVASWENGVKIS